jgi:hypothetical protein
MTAALVRGEWSAARPGRTLPQERPGTHFTGGWLGPRAGLDGRKFSSPTGFFFTDVYYGLCLVQSTMSLSDLKVLTFFFWVMTPCRLGVGTSVS